MAEPGVTRTLARFVAGTSAAAIPAHVMQEGARAFLNFIGCTLGGAREPTVDTAAAALAEIAGPPQATLLGRGARTDMGTAALLNCLASSVHAFDDTYIVSVTHPTGPVAGAVLALAEHRATAGQPVDGTAFLRALILGIEVECRIGCLLTAPPARSPVGLYMTGIAGGFGAAAGAGALLGLDEDRMVWALGIAAGQSSGLRAVHGSMTLGQVPGHAARHGLVAALLAAKGFECSEETLDGPKGLGATFADPPNLAAATDGLGTRWEVLANAYKPYPCGIVIHPSLDACLDLASAHGLDAAAIERIELTVNPLTLALCDRPSPRDVFEAQVSLQHWVAAALVRGAAGLAESREECLRDPRVGAVRARIVAVPDAGLGRDEAKATLALADGLRVAAHVEHGRGSLARPMTDVELDAKFLAQARLAVPDETARALLAYCRRIDAVDDVAAALHRALGT